MNERELTAVKLLEEAKPYLTLIGNDFNIAANGLGDAMIQIEPFKSWRGQLVYQGSGSISPQAFIGHWALELMKEGLSPSDLIDNATKIIKEDSAEFFHITIVAGVAIEEKIKVGSDVEFWPWKDVPLLHGEERVVYNETMLIRRHGLSQHEYNNNLPRFAVVRRFTANPLLTGSDEDAEERRNRERTERRSFSDRIMSALVLSSSRQVRTASEIFVPVCKWTPIRNLGSMFSEYQTGLAGESQTDLKTAKWIYEKLVDFKETEMIHRVSDRIVRARKTNRSVNKAIDFGVALEILLMHGEANNNSEITNKLQTRAGWLLGKDPNSRAKWAREAKNLYIARSKAVHTGELSEKAMKTYDSDKAFQLIKEICIELLNRGKFPVWSELVLGG